MSKYLDGKNLNKRKLAKKKEKMQKKKKTRGLGFKVLCFGIEIHAIICITCSYALAWMNKINVNETLSASIVAEIIAPVVVWGFTRTIENIFEHNKLPFSEPIALDKEQEEEDTHSNNMEG